MLLNNTSGRRGKIDWQPYIDKLRRQKTDKEITKVVLGMLETAFADALYKIGYEIQNLHPFIVESPGARPPGQRHYYAATPGKLIEYPNYSTITLIPGMFDSIQDQEEYIKDSRVFADEFNKAHQLAISTIEEIISAAKLPKKTTSSAQTVINFWELLCKDPDKISELSAGGLPVKQDGFLGVLNARHYQRLRVIMATGNFRQIQNNPWPTAYLDDTKRDYAQLIPPTLEKELLPPEDAAQWAALMFTQQKELTDLDADALDALGAIWLSQAKSPNDRAQTDIDQILSMRGLTPKHKRGKAFRKEQRQEMVRAINRVQSLWLTMCEMETYSGKGKKSRQAIQSRAFVITDRIGQLRLDGFMDDVKVIKFLPGEVFAAFLFGPGRQVALLSSKALEYDPMRQKPEKRLARYFSWHWRTQARDSGFVNSYRVETLLEAVGDDAISPDLIKKRPGEARKRLEKALDQLQEDQVISGWQYERWDEDITDKRGWFDAYRQTTIIIEAPDKIQEHYRSISENTQKRIGIAKAKTKKIALPAPAPAAHLNGLGEKLRTHRRQRKMTQLQIAEILDVSAGRVSQIETGRDNPSAKLQEKIRVWLSGKG